MVGISASFKSLVPRALRKIDADTSHMMDELTRLALDSIVNGSPDTNSPGQPRDLRKPDSWAVTKLSDRETIISTVEPSALSVEDGIRYKSDGLPIKRLHSDLGGFHSVKLTQLGAAKLVEKAIATVKASDA